MSSRRGVPQMVGEPLSRKPWSPEHVALAREMRGAGASSADIAEAVRGKMTKQDLNAQTPDLEATVGRVMRIRNGMVLDADAEALIREEIGALMGTPTASRARSSQQLQEAVAAAHAAFEAIPIGFPLQQNGRTIDHTLLNEAKRLCEMAVADTSTTREGK